jgi:CRISPR-associated protein Csm1
MYRHAWALPCTYGEEGVSLFEQWKAVAALAHASGQKWAKGPAKGFTLVGGDIPGIQDFVYTITSKGAAKGLRGRSFFVQLLGDAVVRRILADLGLCSCNVVYNAGGNFTVLGPAGGEDALREWQGDVNWTLLDEFEGDLYLALAWESLPQSAVGTSEFATVCKRLGTKVAAAKSRCFAEVVERDGWAALFQPQGRGGLDYCRVCQREPRPGEKLVEETTETGETVMKCERCRSFEALARDIAYKKLWMVITEADAAARKGGGWQGTLARLTGSAYRFVNDPSQVNRLETVYVLNSTDLAEVSVHGFRFVANVTPRIEEADRRWVQENHPDVEVPPGERIKDFALMALQSQGIPRVGVLRMDVDNLGTIFGQYLRGSMVQVSTLSAGPFLRRLPEPHL